MIRMQIQFPEDLHDRLRAIAESKEWSLAETIRRASECFAGMFPRLDQSEDRWAFPVANVGEVLAPEESWAEILEEDREGRHLK